MMLDMTEGKGTKYQVITPRILWEYVTVKVPADSEDPEGDAIDLAFQDGPGGICAHCSGGQLMHQDWSRELDDESPHLVEGLPMPYNLTTTVEKLED